MCTVTAIWSSLSGSTGGEDLPLLRVFCNRDEQRSRSASLPPRARVLGGRRMIMPIDPESGGSWIGGNDAGLVICLLNASHTSLAERGAQKRESRGTIVPRVLAGESVSDAVQLALRLTPEQFPPFRLLIADSSTHAIVTSDGASLASTSPSPSRRPVLLTSSGLGDHLVQPVRGALFQQLLRESGDPLDAQRRFHVHAWTGREQLSVLMSRPDARTVSQTVIDVYPTGSLVRHWLLTDDLRPESTVTVRELPVARRASVAA